MNRMRYKELRSIYHYVVKENAFIVDVQLEDYREAYNNWDFSPVANRDMDDDLAEYLLECSYEIPLKYSLILDFHIRRSERDVIREGKSIAGMHNYFGYQVRKVMNHRLRVFKDMLTFLAIGTILLIAGYYSARIPVQSLWITLLSEGLYIGGWVMLWEMFSAWFFDLKKMTLKRRHFSRLNQSVIRYTYGEQSKPPVLDNP